MNVKLQPFLVPNFAILETKPGRRQDGFSPNKTFPISEIGAEELSEMCDEFRREVFKKAGKKDPLK